jgi:hypothetical protein
MRAGLACLSHPAAFEPATGRAQVGGSGSPDSYTFVRNRGPGLQPCHGPDVPQRPSHPPLYARVRSPYPATATSSVSVPVTSSSDPMIGADVEAIPARSDERSESSATWPAVRPAAAPARSRPSGRCPAADRGPHSLGGRDGPAVRRDRGMRGRCAPRDRLGARRRVTGSPLGMPTGHWKRWKRASPSRC